MPARTTQRFPWSRYSERRLLEVRLCDLGLTLEGSTVEPLVNALLGELEQKGLTFRPHAWLSNEWFTPDHVPGIAIPFYLAHPRLIELERSQMLEVEGGTRDWCMRILRHEAGHAIDNAFVLNRRTGYRRLFGDYGAPYPDSYRPKPYSKQFVVHLDMWYAQAHPAEDFAETFAVWLNPRSHWPQHYEKWPAIKKLHYVDALMNRIGPLKPTVRSRRRTHPLHTLKMTLGDHYAAKRAHYCRDHPRFYDRDLRRLFSDDPQFARNRSAAAFLESIRAEARMMISRWTGESQYTIDRTIADMIDRVTIMNLRLAKPAGGAKVDVMMMLAVQTMNFLNDGRHRVVL
jgi:hypothetical protein